VDGKSARFSYIAGAPGYESLPARFSAVGQPVLIGASMGTGSQILPGAATAEQRAFPSACHSAGSQCRAMRRSSNGAGARFRTIWRCRAFWFAARRLATQPEAPGAYKDVGAAVAAAEQAGLAVAFRDCVRSFASRAEIPRRRVDRRTSLSTLRLRFALGQNQAPKAEAVQRARCRLLFPDLRSLTWINAAARLPMHDIPCVPPIGFLFRTFLPVGLESPAR
jgi:hypothetical protein